MNKTISLYELYTARKITKKDIFYGNIHASSDGNNTFCGLELNDNWYILTNAFDGTYNCRKCKKVFDETNLLLGNKNE